MSDEEQTSSEASYELAYLRVLLADLENKNRQTEELIHIVTDQYRRITEVVSDYIFSVHVVDGNPVETVHGRGCLSMTGYSPEEFSSNTFLWINMVFEDDRPSVLRHVAGILSGKDTAPFEHRIIRKDGAIRWVRNTPVCQYDTEGRLLAYDGLIRDVTEHKITEAALRESEEKYRIVADFTYDWEEWIGPDSHYLYVSPSCERITGYSPEEFIANPDLVVMITHPADQAMVAAHYNDTSEGSKEVEHLDFRIITKNGEKRWISHSCQPVFSADGRWLGRRASNHDISRRRELIEELMKSRELEAVGILASGIAHDFNDLISAILGNVSIAKKDVDSDSKAYHLLSNAEDVAVRSHDLTQQLIAFSQRGILLKKRLPIAEVIINIVHTILDNDSIGFEFSVTDDLWPLEADEGQISQAIGNLVQNAKEAMGDAGLLTITVSNTIVRDKDNMLIEPGNYVKISVRDTGSGIPSEDTAKIFDPHFTTKHPGVPYGTGLGLAIAYSIVTSHDGVISVDSQETQGTTFHIYLPASK